MSDLRCRSCGQDVDICKCAFKLQNKPFKTLHENAVNINPLSVERQVELQLEYFKKVILELDKYTPESNSGGQDCWSTMEISKDGEWIKLEDILELLNKV